MILACLLGALRPSNQVELESFIKCFAQAAFHYVVRYGRVLCLQAQITIMKIERMNARVPARVPA